MSSLNYRDDVFPYVPLLVLVVASTVTVLVIGLIREIRRGVQELQRLRRYVNLHHGVLTSVGTMHGLVQALEVGIEAGGIPERARQSIYRAHDEQVRRVYAVASKVTGEATPDGTALMFEEMEAEGEAPDPPGPPPASAAI